MKCPEKLKDLEIYRTKSMKEFELERRHPILNQLLDEIAKERLDSERKAGRSRKENENNKYKC